MQLLSRARPLSRAAYGEQCKEEACDLWQSISLCFFSYLWHVLNLKAGVFDDKY